MPSLPTCNIFDWQQNFSSELCLIDAVFPRTIAGAIFFHTKRGQLFERRRLFEGDDYFKYCSLEFVRYIFCFILTDQFCWIKKGDSERGGVKAII